MEQAQVEELVEQTIEKARLDRSTSLKIINHNAEYRDYYVDINLVKKLPKSIGNLSNLTLVDFTNNQITSLPEEIGNLSNLLSLNLNYNQLSSLPDSIGNLTNLTSSNLNYNQLSSLPDSIGSLTNLTSLNLNYNQLSSLPDSIGSLTNLTSLNLNYNQLRRLPEGVGKLTNLTSLNLISNQLDCLPESIEKLTNLTCLYLNNNQITSLPDGIRNLSRLKRIEINNNPLTDLSMLQNIRNSGYSSSEHSLLKNLSLEVQFMNIDLPHRYWTKFSDWKAEWLLDEDNTEIRHILIEQLGYEKICEELSAIKLDTWREYTLLKIDGVEAVYEEDDEPIDREPMVLLKMTCPSTQHIHILRVPPEMTSAEAAITWVNHGIHPDKFAVQT